MNKNILDNALENNQNLVTLTAEELKEVSGGGMFSGSCSHDKSSSHGKSECHGSGSW